MKHITHILAATMALALLASCKSDDEAEAAVDLTLDKTELTVGADGATEAMTVTAAAEWYASAEEPWVSVSPATGYGSSTCIVTVDSTLINDMRSATVHFTAADGRRQALLVRQTGYGNIIRTDSTEFHIAASHLNRDKRQLDITVTTNVAFDISIQYDGEAVGWLTPQDTHIELDHGARPRTAKLRFSWANNSQPDARSAQIIFTPKDASKPMASISQVTVTQGAGPRIDDNRAGDSLALIILSEALGMYDAFPTSERMDNWGYVRLWEKSDKGLPCPEAIGRVRDVVFYLVNVADGETLPTQIKHLKYLESLSYYSNVNSFLKTVHLGTEVCSLEHLRSLEVFSMGLTDLPQELTQLGSTLESLKIACNNFTEVPAVLTKENFPKLRTLELHANRRWTTSDLRNAGDSRFEGGLGLHFNTNTDNTLKRLLLWDTLEELILSYNYIEGEVPDFKVGEDGVEAWTQQDVDAWGGDTIQFLVGKPKILPKAKRLTLNLNFFTGPMPDWLLYHPRLLDWSPDILIFNQMENGLNSKGQVVRFSNEPSNFEYYYEAFPLYRTKYEIEEEWTEEAQAAVAKYSTQLLNKER